MILPRLLVAIILLTQFAYSESRTWVTSTGQTVDAEIVGFYGPMVFLEKGKKREMVSVGYTYLDAESKVQATQWLKNHIAELEANTPVERSDSILSEYLRDNLVRYDDGKLVPFDFASERDPEFYAFYFSARWCGPCRRFTPQLVAFYNTMKNAGHDNFEVIFVSSDHGTGEMRKYMEEDKMPWPAVKFSKKNYKLISGMKGSGIPCLVITDRHGRILAHSYNGSEYIGPTKPKDLLRNFLINSKRFRENDLFSQVGD